jgi:hypothetical protein
MGVDEYTACLCRSVIMHTHTHTHTHTHIYIYTHTHTLSLSLSLTHTHTHTYLRLASELLGCDFVAHGLNRKLLGSNKTDPMGLELVAELHFVCGSE